MKMKMRLASFCQPGGALLVSFPSFVSFCPEFLLPVQTLYRLLPPPAVRSIPTSPTRAAQKAIIQVVGAAVHSQQCSDIPIFSLATNHISPVDIPPAPKLDGIQLECQCVRHHQNLPAMTAGKVIVPTTSGGRMSTRTSKLIPNTRRG